MGGPQQQFSLRWNNYTQHVTDAIDELRNDGDLCDVTLACEGQKIKSHKLLLSACSTFFRQTFRDNPCKHPVVVLKGVSFIDLEAVVTFMYKGQVNVTQERLPSFLATAELLEIKGLTDMNDRGADATTSAIPAPPTLKKRLPATANSTTNDARTPDASQRPPTPKRRKIVGAGVAQQTYQNHSTDGYDTTSGITAAAAAGPSSSSGGAASSLHPLFTHSDSNSAEDYVQHSGIIKFEEEPLEEEEEYGQDLSEEGDGSMQDLEPGAMGSYIDGASGELVQEGFMRAGGTATEASTHAQRIRLGVRTSGGTSNRKSDTEDSFSASSSQPPSVLDAYNEQGTNYDAQEESNGYDDTEYIMPEGEACDAPYDEYYESELPAPIVTLQESSGKAVRPPPKLMRATPGLFLKSFGNSSSASSSVSIPSMVKTPAKIKIKTDGSSSGGEQNCNGQYPCDICGKIFSHHRSMNDHKKMHTGDTQCPICQKTFSKVANLRAHYKAQHQQNVGYSLEELRGVCRKVEPME